MPAIHPEGGIEYIGKPANWGKEQAEDYEHHRYHQPSDEFNPKWTYDGMIEDAQLGFYTGLIVANTPQIPTWNPGDEFEATRKKSLAEVKGKAECAAFPAQGIASPAGNAAVRIQQGPLPSGNGPFFLSQGSVLSTSRRFPRCRLGVPRRERGGPLVKPINP